MNIKYDSKEDAVYVEFAKGKYDHSRKVTGSILVDEDRKGKVLGIEILDASVNMPKFDPKKASFQVESI
jgi:uncharacterized protein YuzE